MLSTYCVPLSISICMLSMNLTELKKLTKEPVIALISAISSVCLVAIVLGLFFAPRIVEGWKCAGMFVGTYTGGTPNLTAIATGLDTSSETLAAASCRLCCFHSTDGIPVCSSNADEGIQKME